LANLINQGKTAAQEKIMANKVEEKGHPRKEKRPTLTTFCERTTLMRILGLDIGDSTIGVAVSDPLGITAQGIKTIRRKDIESDLEELRGIITEYKVEKIIAGLPKNMNGTIGPQGEKVLEFIKRLEETIDIPIKTWDERLSTVSAEKVLIEGDVRRKKRKKVIDKMAAVFILQNYLDSISGK